MHSPLFLVLLLASLVSAGQRGIGTVTINIKTRSDIVTRLQTVGFKSYGVRIDCQKALGRTSTSTENAKVPIALLSTITAPGCDVDDASGGFPGAFMTFDLYFYDVYLNQTLCGQYPGTMRRDKSPTIDFNFNGCHSYKIPPLGSQPFVNSAVVAGVDNSSTATLISSPTLFKRELGRSGYYQ